MYDSRAPGPGAALDHPATLRTMYANRRSQRGVVAIGGGAAWMLLLLLVGLLSPIHGGVITGLVLGSVGGLPAILIGLGRHIDRRYMERTLASCPWTGWRGYGVRFANTNRQLLRGVVLVDADTGQAHPLMPDLEGPFDWSWIADCDGETVWFAGDPARGGVVSPPGGDRPVRCTRPRHADRTAMLAALGAGE